MPFPFRPWLSFPKAEMGQGVFRIGMVPCRYLQGRAWMKAEYGMGEGGLSGCRVEGWNVGWCVGFWRCVGMYAIGY